MPSLCLISFLVWPQLLGERGLLLIWILLLFLIRHPGSRISRGSLILSCSLVTVGIPFYSPESAQLGCPFVAYITTLDALSLLVQP